MVFSTVLSVIPRPGKVRDDHQALGAYTSNLAKRRPGSSLCRICLQFDLMGTGRQLVADENKVKLVD
jgi:hypothetical protein